MSLLHTTSFFSVCVLATQLAVAHPFHVSTTEVEYNADTERFEVAMRLRIADLEDAISVIQKSRFRIVEDGNLAKPVMDYLKNHFAITHRPHDRCELSWIGCELELHDVWIYFEAKSLPRNGTAKSSLRPPDAATASNRVATWEELLSPETANQTAAPKPDASNRITIRNTALIEIQSQQVNMIAVRIGDCNKTAIHTLKKPQHELVFGEKTAH